MTVRAHAKVNLRLRIFGADAEGFHGLETIFLRLELADAIELEVVPEQGVRLHLGTAPGLTGEGVPSGPDNLACQAAERLLAAVGENRGVEMRLDKEIPSGGGLGGGSSDAAAVLLTLNERLGTPLDLPRLIEIGAGLGSDVPFFLLPHAMSLGWERGRGLLPLPAPPPRPVLLLLPRFAIGSGQAYEWLDQRREVRGDKAPVATALPSVAALRTWDSLSQLAVNDFEDVAFDRYPQLRTWKARLIKAGADIALLSGSGSTMFAVFSSPEARNTAAGLFGEDPNVRILRTSTVSKPPVGVDSR